MCQRRIKMRILITGASGFVGANLTRKLVQHGHEVHIFVRKTSNIWRISDMKMMVSFHEIDICNYPQLEQVVDRIKPQIVFHLATYGGFSFQSDLSKIMEANLQGTINLITACEKIDFPYFINTGSSSEYGIKRLPMKESDLPEPVSNYGVAKEASTLFCQAKAKRNNFPIVTLRLFSPYGPYDDMTRLIPYTIINLIKKRQPIINSPNSVRDYIFMDDVVNAYLKFTEINNITGEIFNIGSGTQYSVQEVVMKICEIIGNGTDPIFAKKEQLTFETNSWVANLTKVKKQLRWKPSVSLEVGLRKTIEWHKKNIHLFP